MNHYSEIAKTHYENFPVGSMFIPKQYRHVIHLIYAYARVADDFADEGLLSPEERVEKIDEWEQMLMDSLHGTHHNIFFDQLADEIHTRNLPVQLFRDLIIAFRQDSFNPTYKTFNEIMEYCRYSANPIGRLMLAIFGSADEENVLYSDNICTALQLTNFWQDISIDSKRNRFYIPLEDFLRFGISFDDEKYVSSQTQFQSLMKFQVDRTRNYFLQGFPLIQKVHKDFRRELLLIYNGGMRILEKIERLGYDTRSKRPKLSVIDALIIVTRALQH